MSYQESRFKLNKNVVVTRQFQGRIAVFFKVIFLYGPLGQTQYYAIRADFQVRGSPHIHSFVSTLSEPNFLKLSKEVYAKWMDEIVCADLAQTKFLFCESLLFESKTCMDSKVRYRTCF